MGRNLRERNTHAGPASHPRSSVENVYEHARVIVEEMSAGRAVALAVVVSISGSAPRPVGTSMVVTRSGQVFGSLSGGCVESAVVQVANEVAAGAPPATEVFGYSDSEALSVGLMCGGAVEVIVLRVDETTPADVLEVWRAAARADRSPDPVPTDRALALEVAGDRLGALSSVSAIPTGPIRVDDADGSRLVCPVPRRPPFLIYGGVDIAGPLAEIARLTGYRVTVCDARPVFADPARFPAADEVVRAQPAAHLAGQPDDPAAVICVLTHEDRFDIPLLTEALSRRAAYVGAMGSRATCARREHLLLEGGVTPDALARLHAPIGLDLGGSSPQDTALAIIAEVVAVRHGRSGGRLRVGSGPLHAAAGVSRVPPARPDRD